MKFYKLINSSGYVLSNHYENAGELVLGYGGVVSLFGERRIE